MAVDKSKIPEAHIKHEFFKTPQHTLRAFLEAYTISPDSHVVDCSGGSGAFGEALRAYYPQDHNITLTQVEIRSEELPQLAPLGYTIIGDYLKMTPDDFNDRPPVDLVLSNPPFSLAKDFVEQSFNLFGDSVTVAFLLPLSFLATKKRKDFINQSKITDVLVCSKRPCFLTTGTQTAMADYAFIVFNGHGGGIRSI